MLIALSVLGVSALAGLTMVLVMAGKRHELQLKAAWVKTNHAGTQNQAHQRILKRIK